MVINGKSCEHEERPCIWKAQSLHSVTAPTALNIFNIHYNLYSIDNFEISCWPNPGVLLASWKKKS